MRMFLFAALAGAASLLAAGSPGPARADGIAVSEPVAHGNLAIYFIHGPSAPGPVPLTLQEAMVKETVRVIETGSVNELKIENIGGEDVFIQSGDIVKGGRQDRVLTVSFILPRKSGEVPVASYCVEHGRWSGRGNESSTRFASSYNALPSREAKLAMKAPPPAAAGRLRPMATTTRVSARERFGKRLRKPRENYRLACMHRLRRLPPRAALSFRLRTRSSKKRALNMRKRCRTRLGPMTLLASPSL